MKNITNRKIILIILCIAYVVIDIIFLVNGQNNGFSWATLFIVNLPLFLFIIFNKRIISNIMILIIVGIQALNTLLPLISNVLLLINGNSENYLQLVLTFLANMVSLTLIVMMVISIISELLKGELNKRYNIIIIALTIIYLSLSTILFMFTTPVNILLMLTTHLLLIIQVIQVISQEKENVNELKNDKIQ